MARYLTGSVTIDGAAGIFASLSGTVSINGYPNGYDGIQFFDISVINGGSLSISVDNIQCRSLTASVATVAITSVGSLTAQRFMAFRGVTVTIDGSVTANDWIYFGAANTSANFVASTLPCNATVSSAAFVGRGMDLYGGSTMTFSPPTATPTVAVSSGAGFTLFSGATLKFAVNDVTASLLAVAGNANLQGRWGVTYSGSGSPQDTYTVLTCSGTLSFETTPAADGSIPDNATFGGFTYFFYKDAGTNSIKLSKAGTVVVHVQTCDLSSVDLPNCPVRLSDGNVRRDQTGTTNSSGDCTFTAVRPGTYTVSITPPTWGDPNVFPLLLVISVDVLATSRPSFGTS